MSKRSDKITKLPSAFDLFEPSINVVKRYLVPLTLLVVVSAAFGLLLSKGLHVTETVDQVTKHVRVHYTFSDYWPYVAALSLLFALVTYPFQTYILFRSAEGKTDSLGELLRDSVKYWFRLLLLLALSGAIFIVATLLLIVPLFFALRSFYLAPYFLIDQDLGVIDALKASHKATAKTGWAGFTVAFVGAILTVLSLIPYVGMAAYYIAALFYSAAPALRYLQVKRTITSAAK